VILILYFTKASAPDNNHQMIFFIVWGVVMGLGGVAAWLYIPNVQYFEEDGDRGRLKNKTLEVLGGGIKLARERGQKIGIVDRLRKMKKHEGDCAIERGG
jgi:hypothetical protein